MSVVLADAVEEGVRLVEAADGQGLTLRLLGGVGVFLRCPDARTRPELQRVYKDLDVATTRGTSKRAREFFAPQGYEANQQFNALHGASRLLFYDGANERQIDVFISSFEMCHKLDLEPRLSMPGPALPASDLLLSKLQIVHLNMKDITDAITLLLQYEPAPDDRAEALSTEYIGRIAANDWGWYTTLSDNLGTVRQQAPQILQSPEDARTVEARIDTLLAAMDAAPKSFGWKMRARVGRRMQWYELPEEVEQ